MTWYSKPGSGGQGLVIDEADGRTVAVACDGKDAELLAAAPEVAAERDRLREANRILLVAARLVRPAIQSLMDEAAGTRATDWSLVNECLLEVSKSIAFTEGRSEK